VIDANDLERLARERPDEFFLKGSGILKLTGGLRQLEALNRELAAEMSKLHSALSAVVTAWESTPSGYTTGREIQRWIVEDMKPAIDGARDVLAVKDKP